MLECYILLLSLAVSDVIKQYHDEADVIQCHHHFFKSTSISLGGSKKWDSTVFSQC